MLCALNFCYYHEQLFLLIFIVFFSILCYNLVIFQGGDEILAYLALYRKYRPTNFNDLVGQNEIVNIIKNEILNNKLSHAYLFSGPRGTGKTSTAKIIARMINCSELGADGVPCGVCENCKNFNSNSDIVIYGLGFINVKNEGNVGLSNIDSSLLEFRESVFK